jgi:uncharacterized protein YjiS (DUF1127 family)
MTQLVLMLNNYLQRPITEIVSVISNAFFALAKAYERYADRRATYYHAQHTIRELSRLSDKDLNDIGISRGQILEVAYSKNFER